MLTRYSRSCLQRNSEGGSSGSLSALDSLHAARRLIWDAPRGIDPASWREARATHEHEILNETSGSVQRKSHFAAVRQRNPSARKIAVILILWSGE